MEPTVATAHSGDPSMTGGAVCFTRALDGLVHSAAGDFHWKGPQVTISEPAEFKKMLNRKFVGLNGDEVDVGLEHAAKLGGAVAMVIMPGQPTTMALLSPGEGEGVPPRPEQWVWHRLRDGAMESQG